MLRRSRLAVAMCVLGGTLAVAGCPKEGDDTRAPSSHRAKPERLKPPPRNMPKPLPVPSKPQLAVHVADPAQALAVIGDLAGRDDLRGMLAELASVAPIGFDPALARYVDLERPWSAAVVEGQLVVQLPVVRSHLAAVQQLLVGKPKVGDFGAVSLQRAAGDASVAVAWLDEPNASLTLAGDERGIATGRELGRAYGKLGVFVVVDTEMLRKHAPGVPISRVTVTGKDVGDVHLAVDGVGAVDGLSKITEGALTGLVGAPELALGASSRYAGYQTVVKQLISEATREVSRQNFLIRGVLEDMLSRYNAVLRSWNGRVMVGLGPKQHVVFAMGAGDPKKAVGALGQLIDAANDNLDLARTFGVSVPRLRFKRNASTSAGVNVHTLTMDKAKSLVPGELAPLLDGSGSLRIAFAGSPHAGAAMFAIGPDAAGVLSRWLEHTKGAPSGQHTEGDLLAGSIAVSPAHMEGLRGNPSLAPLLALSADRAPISTVVTRKGQDYAVHVRQPVPKVEARQLAPTAGRASVEPRAQTEPRARPGAPARARPVAPGRTPAGVRAGPRTGS